MALDKVIDSAQLDAGMKATADAIREKTGGTDPIVWDSANGFKAAVEGIQAGGGDDEWFNDGNTHIWITLSEGRTSPKVGVCPNGTVTVDWGDGTEPDMLTGTSTSTVKWTPTHNYAKPGDYVITLRVNGDMGLSGKDYSNGYSYLLRYDANLYSLNQAYQSSITKVEVGDSTSISDSAFSSCYSLTSVAIPNSVTSIGDHAFDRCYSLKSVAIPNSVTSIGPYAFSSCSALKSVAIPNSVTSIGPYAFSSCYSLTSVAIPNSVTSIGDHAFYVCSALKSVAIPNSVTSISDSAFSSCYSLTSVAIPNSVTSIGDHAFSSCPGVAYYDFTRHVQPPTLSNTNAFNGIFVNCEIRVPAALVDEWKAATNWATYASKIVGV